MEIAKLLSLTKEQVLEIPNQKLLKLIQYTGIDAFVSLYGAGPEYLEQLYNKLGTEELSADNQPLFQNPAFYEEEEEAETPVQEIRPSRMSPEDIAQDKPTMEMGRSLLEVQSTGTHFVASKKPQISTIPSPGPEVTAAKTPVKRELDMEVFGYQLNLTGIQPKA